MHPIIDRRLAGRNKSIGNRERFLRRYRDQIKDAVRKAVGDRSIHNIEEGADISLPRRDVSEPEFHHGPGGRRELVPSAQARLASSGDAYSSLCFLRFCRQ